MVTNSKWSSKIPVSLFLLFFLVDPLLLTPYRYGMLAVCISATALIGYLDDWLVNPSVLIGGTSLLIASLLSAINSGYMWNALEYSLIVATATLILSLMGTENEESDDRFLHYAIIGTGLFFLIVIGAKYIYQVSLFGFYGLFRIPPWIFENPNVAGRFFGLMAIFSFLSNDHWTYRWGLGSIFSLVLLLSGSRGAILALLVTGLVLVFLTYPISRQNRLTKYIALGAAALLTFMIIGNPTKITNLQRVKLVFESLFMVSENPFFGVGGWNFGLVYPSVSFNEVWQRHAHNLPLMILAEWGIAGFVCVTAVILYFIENRLNSQWYGLIVFLLVHELVDTMIWIPGIAIFCLMTLHPLSNFNRSRKPGGLFLLLASSTLVFGSLVFMIDTNHRKAIKSMRNNGTYENNFVLKYLPGFPGFHDSVKKFKGGEDVSLKKLARTLHYNHYDSYYYDLTSEMLRSMGHPSLAQTALERATKMDPHGMLEFTDDVSNGDQPEGSVSVSEVPAKAGLFPILNDSTNPRSYFPVILNTMENGEYFLASNQIKYLLNFPRLTSEHSAMLKKIYREIRERTSDVRSINFGDVKSVTPRDRRQQYHRFFYRRPGRDYANIR